MNKRRVEKVLRFYRTIPDEIKLYREKRADVEDNYNPINGIKTYDDLSMPRGTTVSDQTAATASRLTGYESDQIKAIDEYISGIERLATEIFSVLKRLPYYEKMVVYRFYLDDWSWVKVAFALRYSEKQCMRHRDIAMDKLSKLFQENATIINFRYPN